MGGWERMKGGGRDEDGKRGGRMGGGGNLESS